MSVLSLATRLLEPGNRLKTPTLIGCNLLMNFGLSTCSAAIS